MELQRYLNTTFPGLILKPSLYQQWVPGLHFEFSQGMYQFKDDHTLNLDMFNRVYDQALTLFNELFSDGDEIFLVTNKYCRRSSKGRIKPLKLYSRMIKNKDLIYRLKQRTRPCIFADADDREEIKTIQFCLKCRKKDLRYSLLIKAVCNKDFPLRPKLGGEKEPYPPDVFFVNITRNLIYFIYDDRGCDVIATKEETLRRVYQRYDKWLAQNDKDKIRKVFGCAF